MRTLILGGVRSGKSRQAENLAAAGCREVIYVATASAGDAAMAERIAAHRARRPADWRVVEEEIRLAAVLDEHADANRCLLVDCLSLWMTNLLMREDEGLIETETAALIAGFERAPGELILVSSESGFGVVPLGELSRRYCDLIGVLHQQVAAVSDRVVLSVAGLPQILKGDPL